MFFRELSGGGVTQNTKLYTDALIINNIIIVEDHLTSLIYEYFIERLRYGDATELCFTHMSKFRLR